MGDLLPAQLRLGLLRLKQAIDARDGDEAAKCVDFQSVVKKAGQEMVRKQGATDPLSAMLGNAAIDLLTKPMAQVAQAWVIKKVDDGAHEVQMPNAAVAGAVIVLHRDATPRPPTSPTTRASAGESTWRAATTAIGVSPNRRRRGIAAKAPTQPADGRLAVARAFATCVYSAFGDSYNSYPRGRT